ncbi:SDR family NAD(P)-dependent oxidoreductase [Bradyrhizobium sp. HKCCYLS20291]|uniref:SDR family NAD(P)-dependent oxidoreductase n=1 Tax=Bradyrhizobium sp. HKCCYLS20291 TaxID=3420766 RepID=UPI003EB8A76D
MKLENIRAIVTGAASGIGRQFALQLARSGASLVAVDIDSDGLRSLAREGQGAPGRLLTAQVDVTREDEVKAAVEDALAQLEGLDTLVNCAGILRDGLLVAPEEEWVRKLPTAQWKAVIDTNLTGPYLMAREVAAAMLRHRVRPGLIVNVSSVTSKGNPGQSNYSASKAGLDALTRTWGLELAPHGIRVAGIAPGLTDTPMLATMSSEQRERLLAQVPLGRVGTTEEIWLALEFIIRCDYFTARVIDIDGGATF